MIKLIKRYQIKLTPFEATKDWAMSTTNNQDLLLMNDPSVDPADEPVALEFIDYGNGSDVPVVNDLCDIALEQQPDDLVNTRLGLNVQGLFYPDTDPINTDKTYKRMVYTQVKTLFYNDYRDPTKIWGIDTLDFELSKTKRKISDEIKLFDVPRLVYGEKIIPKTVILQDNSLDDNVIMTDDGNGNLIAGTNLFSHHQEVGEFSNLFVNGYLSYCNDYFDLTAPNSPILSGIIIFPNSMFTSSLSWNEVGKETGYVLEKSIDNISFFALAYTTPGEITYNDKNISYGTTYYYRVYAYNLYGNSNYSNVISLTPIAFDSVISLTGSLTGTSSMLSTIASLTWSNIPVFPATLSLYRATNYSIIAYPLTNSTSYNDTTFGIGSTHYYKLETSNSYSSSFTNEISLSRYGALDTFDDYTSGNSSSFTGGTGSWNGFWKVDAYQRLIAHDTFDIYTDGASSNFNFDAFSLGTPDWVSKWQLETQSYYLAASESFDNYSIGQSSSFSDESSWNTSWDIR